MRTLSKSKLMAFRQCPKRLWLEVHRPELREDSAATRASFAVGNTVGDLARTLYDPAGTGALIERDDDDYDAAFDLTQALLGARQPLFEAGFREAGAQAFADVLLPVRHGGKPAWRMVEVKSSASVKDYYHDDVATQAYVARAAGLPLAAVAVAHLDSDWVYPGGGDYDGLLTEVDLTAEAFGRGNEVRGWIAEAHQVVALDRAPERTTGDHCGKPYPCGFHDHCRAQEPQAEHPVDWLPNKRSNALRWFIRDHAVREMRDVPDELLNDQQLRVKAATLSGEVYFDRAAAARDLRPQRLPATFLDFETIMFAVPIWKGTSPYQTIPFQFSVQRLSRSGQLDAVPFLDLSGDDPSARLAAALIEACGTRGPIFVYNAGFERRCIGDLATRFPRMKAALLALSERLVDLLPVARDHYYHPSQEGSWSIKCVLPALCPGPGYEALDGVQDGGMAMEAYVEAIAAGTTAARKDQIRQQLLDYCALDTLAMVRLWSAFSGQPVAA